MNGQALRGGRISRGIRSAQQIADVLGVTAETVRSWERHRAELPDDVVERYLGALREIEARAAVVGAPRS